MSALEDALNAVYKVKESRPLWKTYGIALILTVSASLLIIAALTVFLYGGALVQAVSNTVGLRPIFYWTWKIAQWPIASSLCVAGCFDGLLCSAKLETTLLAMAESGGAVRHARLDCRLRVAAPLFPFLYQLCENLRFARRGDGTDDLALRHGHHVIAGRRG